MDVKTGEILQATGGKPLGPLDEAASVHGVSTDTRTIEKGSAFFALKGPRFDGHDFLKEAAARGATLCVVSDPKRVPAELKKTCSFIQVADTLRAYGDLAHAYRLKFRIPVIAITGSVGKTTAKELIAHVLSQRFNVLKNRGTENNLVGVPKTIFQLDSAHEVLVLELGTNQPGEIERLGSIAEPQIAIITQIGQSHLEGLKNVEGVRVEKLSLLKTVERGGLIALNGEDPMLADVKSGVHKIVRVGFPKEGNNVVAEQIWCHEKGLSFHLDRFLDQQRGETTLFETQLIGRHNVQACLYAVTVAAALGVEFPLIQKAVSSFRPVPGRLVLKTIDGIHFIDDTYNSNPSSFRAALDTLKEFKIRERKGVVCGDMMELGDHAEAMHRQMGAVIAELLFDYVIAAGPLCKHLVDEALKKGFDPSRIRHAKDAAEAGKILREIATAGDMVLVKGSRGTKMETVFECFTISSTR